MKLNEQKKIYYVLHAIEVIRPTPLCECDAAVLLTKTNATLMEGVTSINVH